MNNPPTQPEQIKHMQRALTLARRGLGKVEPNPMVGCVVVKAGRVIGEGYHRRFGGAHAEVIALKQAGAQARASTVFLTLEPCAHHGKTPPCTEALIRTKVRCVICSLRDPNPLVAGRGLRQLRKAGIDSQLGLLSEQAADLNAPYLKLQRQGLPYVIAKWAQSVDGKIATSKGESKWISSPASRKLVQRLRGRVDAILVGSRTVLADDPRLTCRLARPRRIATRVVLDTRLRIPLGARLVQSARAVPVMVCTSAKRSRSSKADELRQAGVTVFPAPLKNNHVSLSAVLRRLGKNMMTNVMIEGGGVLLGSAFDLGLIDEVYAFVCPMIIGGAGAPSAVVGQGRSSLSRMRQFAACTTRRSGRDTLYHFKI